MQKYNKRKRWLAFCICFTMLFAMFGCGNNNEAVEEEGNFYLTDFYDVDGNPYISAMRRVEDTFYMVSSVYKENITEYSRLVFDLNDRSMEEILLETTMQATDTSDDGFVAESIYASENVVGGMGVVINSDGSMEAWEFLTEFDENWNEILRLDYFNRYDQNGNLISTEPFKEIFDIPEDSYIGLFDKDALGNYVIGGTGETIKVYSSDFNKIGEIEKSEQVVQLCLNDAGTMVGSFISEKGEFIVVPIDTQQLKMGEEIVLEKSQGSTLIWPGPDNLIFYENGSCIYSCDVYTGEQIKLFDCADIDLNVDCINNIFFLDESRFLLHYHDYISGTTSLVFLTQVDPAVIEARTELILATIYPGQDIQNAVVAFNHSNMEYRITLVDYGVKDYDYAESIENLQKDIVAGNVPDIIDIGSNSYPWQNWASKDILTDLYPLMETEGGLEKEDLLDNVRDAYEVNGELYILPSTLTLNCMMAKSSNVKGITVLTPETMFQLEEGLAADANLFFWHNQENIMMNMVYHNLTQFVDYEKGECYFNTPEFKEILEYVQAQPEEFEFEEGAEIIAYLRTDKAILHDLTMSQSVDYQFFKEMFGGDVTCLGFGNGDMESLELTLCGSALAITESCQNKDVAWQFVEFYVTGAGQNTGTGWGIPSTKAGFETFLTDAGERQDITQYTSGDVTLEIGNATEEDIEEMRALMERANVCYYTDNDIVNIIQEEVTPYFKGQKTAEDVMDIIQSRVELYLKEGQ